MQLLWMVYLLVFLIALVQTPLLVDAVRLLRPQWRVKRLTGHTSSALLVLLMTTFFSIAMGQQLFLFIPLMPAVANRSLKLTCHCLFAYWVWLNMVFNYYCAVFVQPGSSTEPVEGKEALATHDAARNPADSNLPKSGVEWISKRSHFCKVCNAEVSYMDHHCPFTGNCVGFRNFSYFFLSLSYGTLGLGYGVATVLVYFGECALPNVWLLLGLATAEDINSQLCDDIRTHGEIFLPVVGGFVVALCVLVFQVFLLLADLTTHDILKNFWKLPVVKFGLQRIRAGRFLYEDSRLRVLLLEQRPHVWQYLLPIKTDSKLYTTMKRFE